MLACHHVTRQGLAVPMVGKESYHSVLGDAHTRLSESGVDFLMLASYVLEELLILLIFWITATQSAFSLRTQDISTLKLS